MHGDALDSMKIQGALNNQKEMSTGVTEKTNLPLWDTSWLLGAVHGTH